MKHFLSVQNVQKTEHFVQKTEHFVSKSRLYIAILNNLLSLDLTFKKNLIQFVKFRFNI